MHTTKENRNILSSLKNNIIVSKLLSVNFIDRISKMNRRTQIYPPYIYIYKALVDYVNRGLIKASSEDQSFL